MGFYSGCIDHNLNQLHTVTHCQCRGGFRGGAPGARQCTPLQCIIKINSYSYGPHARWLTAVNTVLKRSDHNCLPCNIINNDQLGGINKCLGSCGPLVIMRGGSYYSSIHYSPHVGCKMASKLQAAVTNYFTKQPHVETCNKASSSRYKTIIN